MIKFNITHSENNIDFNFGRHKDLSTFKSDVHLGLAASVNYHFFEYIYPHVYLTEVNNCIISQGLSILILNSYKQYKYQMTNRVIRL